MQFTGGMHYFVVGALILLFNILRGALETGLELLESVVDTLLGFIDYSAGLMLAEELGFITLGSLAVVWLDVLLNILSILSMAIKVQSFHAVSR